ncbi:MAG: hypothetical protein QNJ78_08460 [Gammaproteobacteria bacterium]|nr:hypothetical protein [Gammaproteobacteria bacterium]
MKTNWQNTCCWPEDPAWPERTGNDPYDINGMGLHHKNLTGSRSKHI